LGTSPKEQASSDFNTRLQGLQQRYLGGDLSGGSLMNQVNPYFEQGKNDLNQSLSTRMMGIGQNVGQSLMTSGVPKGAPQANLFAGAMAPAIAENQQEMGNLAEKQGGTLADLLKTSLGLAGQAGQQELGAISGMKDSTTMGDIMGGLTSTFSLTDIFTNPKLLQMLFGGKDSPNNPGGISSGSNNAINNPLPF
jgi:hypothetical protein